MKRYLVALVAAVVWASVPVQAQEGPVFDPSGLKMQRAELERLLLEYETYAASEAYSGSRRDQARREAAQMKDRLTNGDFRLGDRIMLTVQGQEDIPDTLTVLNGPKISIPMMGEIPLNGVLRSELETHLTEQLKRYLRNPVLRASALIRVGIMGSVGNTGYFVLPADMLLTEALMEAGGPAASADMKNIRIERTGQVLWNGEELQSVLADGRTLDQLNLRAGDQIVLPAVPAGGSKLWQVTRWAVPFAASLIFGYSVFR
jgi:protein involved in polysaccharide export with SLBB domain